MTIKIHSDQETITIDTNVSKPQLIEKQELEKWARDMITRALKSIDDCYNSESSPKPKSPEVQKSAHDHGEHSIPPTPKSPKASITREDLLEAKQKLDQQSAPFCHDWTHVKKTFDQRMRDHKEAQKKKAEVKRRFDGKDAIYIYDDSNVEDRAKMLSEAYQKLAEMIRADVDGWHQDLKQYRKIIEKINRLEAEGYYLSVSPPLPF